MSNGSHHSTDMIKTVKELLCVWWTWTVKYEPHSRALTMPILPLFQSQNAIDACEAVSKCFFFLYIFKIHIYSESVYVYVY